LEEPSRDCRLIVSNRAPSRGFAWVRGKALTSDGVFTVSSHPPDHTGGPLALGATAPAAAAAPAPAAAMPRAAKHALREEGNGAHAGDAKAADLDAPSQAQAQAQPELDRAYRKVTVAILPLFILSTALSMIDRNNLSYASISLMPALGLNPTAYGARDGGSRRPTPAMGQANATLRRAPQPRRAQRRS
jgi:hypothetical protein